MFWKWFLCTPTVNALVCAIKLPCVEAIIGLKGKMTQVKCTICNEGEKNKKLLVPKFNGL